MHISHFFAVNLPLSFYQKGVKTSLSLVNEFTGADVSLDRAAGGGSKVLQPKRKARMREGEREGEKPGTKTVQSEGY